MAFKGAKRCVCAVEHSQCGEAIASLPLLVARITRASLYSCKHARTHTQIHAHTCPVQDTCVVLPCRAVSLRLNDTVLVLYRQVSSFRAVHLFIQRRSARRYKSKAQSRTIARKVNQQRGNSTAGRSRTTPASPVHPQRYVPLLPKTASMASRRAVPSRMSGSR